MIRNKFIIFIIFILSFSFSFSFDTQKYNWRNVKIEGGGGFVPGIVFNPTQKGLVYARTDIGGVYRSTDSGKTWNQLLNWVSFDEWNLLGAESVATDPIEPNRLYIAAGTYTNSWTNMNGEILISEDYGETFTRVPLPFKLGGNMPGRNMGERLVIDPNKNNILYLGTREGNGLWKSIDYGRSWHKVESFPNPGTYVQDPNCPYDYMNHITGVVWIVFDKKSSNLGEPTKVIYVGVADLNENIYITTDSGNTWRAIPNQPTGLLPQRAKLSDNGWLYITYSNTQGPYDGDKGRVYRYNTTTGEWQEISPMKYEDCYFGYGGVTVDVQNPNVIMVTALSSWWPDTFIWRSTDGGITWKCIWEWAGYPTRTLHYELDYSLAPWLDFGNTNPQPPEVSPKLGWMVACIEIDPFDSDNMLYVTGATIYGTENLTAWDRGEKVNIRVRAIGVEETAVLGLVSHPDGCLFSCLGDIAGFRHDDINKAPKWFYKTPTWGTTTDLDFAENMTNFIVRVGNVDRTWNPNVNRIGFSYDKGDNWFQASSEPPGVTNGGKVAVVADGSCVIWSPEGTSGVYYTTNNGSSWNQCSGLEGTGYILRSDRVNPNKVYAFKDGKFYLSIDKGVSFQLVNTQLPNTGTFKVVWGKEGHIWFVSDNEINGGMWRSTDSGYTFTKLPNVQRAASIGFGKPKNDGEYPSLYSYALIESVRGIFRSDDEGQTWIRINDDKNQFGCANADITGDRKIYGRVYLATNGLGIKVGDIADLQTQPNQEFVLNITVTPQGSGYVLRNPNQSTYPQNTQVQLNAVASDGYVFSHWSGDLNSSENPVTLVMNSSKTIVANFTLLSSTPPPQSNLQNFPVVVNIIPESAGRVVLDPPGGVYLYGTTVTATALPNEGYIFNYWSGSISSTNSVISIIVDSTKTLVANFYLFISTDQRPIISYVNLINGATVSSETTIEVECNDDHGITKVEFYIDGNLKYVDTIYPYLWNFNTNLYQNGPHTLVIVAYDTQAQQTAVSISLFIYNNGQTESISDLESTYLLSLNNDNINDTIELPDTVKEFKIYDLNGNLKLTTKTKKIDKNTKLSAGVYIYKAELKERKTKVGKIIVIK